jgi:hypothetical protein
MARSLTIAQLWELLRETYEKNRRDICWAYGENIFAKVDRTFSNNSHVPERIIVTNRRPVTEEYLQFIIKRRFFLAVFTLRRRPAPPPPTVTPANYYAKMPMFAHECRLFDGWFNLVAGGSNVAADESYNGPVVPVVPIQSAAFHDKLDSDLAVRCNDDFNPQAMELGDDAESEESAESEGIEDEDDDDGDDNDNDNDGGHNEDDDGNTDSASQKFNQQSTASSKGSGLTEKGKKFGAKGIRRQHWAKKCYRDFFHQFLFAIRYSKHTELFNYYDEDRRV